MGSSIELITVYKLDQLTRRGIGHGFCLIQFFKKHGTKVRSHTEAFLDLELAPEIQDLILSVMLWAAQMESSRTSDRIKSTYEQKKAEAKKNGKKLSWGRKKNSFKFDIEIIELKKILRNNPNIGYGTIAKHFTYFDKKTRAPKVPSRSAIKERLYRLGVRKILSKNSKGKLIPKWMFNKSTDKKHSRRYKCHRMVVIEMGS